MWKRIALWAVRLLARAAAEELLKKAKAKQFEAADALKEIQRLKTVALQAAAEAELIHKSQGPMIKALLDRDGLDV